MPINPYFLVFELLVLLLFILCLRHGLRQGKGVAWQLLVGVFYGLLLEWATIQQLSAYQYGRFFLMLGEVPVMVGVAWGTIIYSVRLFSNATSLAGWARPVLDGLLALNIDLAMDAVAIRLGMWEWGIPLDRQFFGVPYANFWAWFWVVFSFSAGLRLLSSPHNWRGRWLGPLGAFILGLGGVLATNAFISFVVPWEWHMPLVLATLGSALLLVLWRRPRFNGRHPHPLAGWVPSGFHAYFLIAGLISGVILQPPALLFVSLVMAALALYLHRGTFREIFVGKGPIDG